MPSGLCTFRWTLKVIKVMGVTSDRMAAFSGRHPGLGKAFIGCLFLVLELVLIAAVV